MVSQIYPQRFNLIKQIPLILKCLDLRLFISYDIVSTKVYDKREDFDFEIVYFPFLNDDVLSLNQMKFTFLNPFNLLEHLPMLLTSTFAINC